MRVLLVRTDSNIKLPLDTAATTGAELRQAIADTYNFNPQVGIVRSGKIISNEDTIDPSMDGASIVLVKWRRPYDILTQIQQIASKNPLFLSYLAVNPLKAMEIMNKDLN